MRQGWMIIRQVVGAGLALLLLVPFAAAHDDVVTLERLRRGPILAADRADRLLHRAAIARADGHLAEAESLLNQVAARTPGSAGLARARAQLALDHARPESALRALAACNEPALANDPRVPWLRADALVRLARLDEAARIMDQAIARFGPARPEQVLARAQLAEQRAGEGPAGALVHLDAGLARWPGAWPLASRALDLEVSLGRYDAALARVDRPLASSPAHVALLARRGDVLAAAGRALEAHEAWSIALDSLESSGRARAADREFATRLHAELAQPLTAAGSR